jgi:uncharacterized protein
MIKITSFVLKIASRCNLNCSYCYMYNLGDKTYLNQPKFMSIETIKAFANQFELHSNIAGIKYAQIVFHGGEPLLLNPEYFKNCVTIIKETVPNVEFSFTVQTNGVLLNQEWFDVFKSHEIRLGISLDGPKKYHDEYRVFHNGKGSYEDVVKGFKLAKKNGFVAILMVLNPELPAKDFYDEIKKLEVESLNLLFPDGHYDQLPFGIDKLRFGDEDYTPYADWLIELFQIWKKDIDRPAIRFFEDLVEMLLGGNHSGNQNFGKKQNGVVVIETNGNIEVVDSLRASFEGITRNNVNVHNNKIQDIFEDDIFDIYYNSHEKVCEKCLNCPVYDICGGGFLGNRYALKNGFDNPTIYCKDIIRLLSHIQNDILETLPANTLDKLEVEPLSYEWMMGELKNQGEELINKQVKEKLISFKQNH